MKRIYLSGKITGDPDYRDKFAKAEAHYKTFGHAVMNPAVLPDGFEYDQYMSICLAMVEACDAVVLLPCWKDSPGAKVERKHAESMGIPVMEWTP